jgi:serine/threonine-protein kinase
MGQVDATDPTELAPSENETTSVRAWGLDDGDLAEVPTQRITPGRITTAAVLASLVVVAMAVAVVLHHLHQVGPASPAMVQASAPPVSPAVVAPPKPQLPLLNGTYRIFYDWANTTARNNERKGGGTVHWNADGLAAYGLFAISSTCTQADCIATGHYLDHGKPRTDVHTLVLQLVNMEWHDVSPVTWQDKCTYVDTGAVAGEATQTQAMDFVAQLDGSFRGAMTTTTVSDECGDKGDTSVTPVTMTRVSP